MQQRAVGSFGGSQPHHRGGDRDEAEVDRRRDQLREPGGPDAGLGVVPVAEVLHRLEPLHRDHDSTQHPQDGADPDVRDRRQGQSRAGQATRVVQQQCPAQQRRQSQDDGEADPVQQVQPGEPAGDPDDHNQGDGRTRQDPVP